VIFGIFLKKAKRVFDLPTQRVVHSGGACTAGSQRGNFFFLRV
jgi:hypothetical protein